MAPPISTTGMKHIPLILIPLFCCLGALSAQDGSPYRSYFFEGDEVVFEFDLRYFEEATKNGKRVEFDDLNVYEVAVAGDFNNWSRQEWHMKKVGPGRYQLRKPIADFDDAFKWEFKFVVNGAYWAEPSKVRDKSKVIQGNRLWDEAYNHDLFTVQPSSDGNARFFLPGFAEAEQVLLTGSFNGWDEESFEMNRVEDGWALRLNLEAGRYEYKFIVDGEWMHDPNNPETVTNRYRTLNSVYEIKKETTFILPGHETAEKVLLAGSFTNWAQDALRMHREGNAWVVRLPLTGGKHHYKFIVDGKWITDPENPLKEYDWEGHVNSVKMVR